MTQPAHSGPPSGARFRGPVLGLAGVSALLLLAACVGPVALHYGAADWVENYQLTNTVLGLSFVASGLVIAWHVPRNSVGWLFLVAGIAHLASAAFGPLAILAEEAQSDVVSRIFATAFLASWQFGAPGLLPLAVLVFPDGRLPSRRWTPVAAFLVATMLAQVVTGLLDPTASLDGTLATTSLLSLPAAAPQWVIPFEGIASGVASVLPVVALLVRYLRGDERTRRQLLWLALAMIATLLLNLQRWWTGDGPILLLLSFVLIPVAIAIGIVRYGLLDITFVVSRTVLYTVLLGVSVAVYAGLVAAFSLLVPEQGDRAVAVGAALVVAIGFTPLRLLLRRGIDRAFYGSRTDPAGTAARVNPSVLAEDFGAVLVKARTALRLPALRLLAPDGSERAAATGAAVSAATPLAELPLVYRQDRVGTLQVSLRRGETTLHPEDRIALELLATPLAVAMHATELGRQIQRARTAVVEAAAEERSRLQRELHDGIGPALTGLAFRADAASNLVTRDPAEAKALLDEIRSDLRDVVADVRRVVYGLQPIELESLDLVEALRQRLGALTTDGGPRFTIDAPALPTDISPAVELAAFRIVTEAATNVVRHSRARTCAVTIRLSNGGLELTVVDDGPPPALWRPGVGLTSLTERAEELGGHASAGPTEAGWRVSARLPMPDTLGSQSRDAVVGGARLLPALPVDPDPGRLDLLPAQDR